MGTEKEGRKKGKKKSSLAPDPLLAEVCCVGGPSSETSKYLEMTLDKILYRDARISHATTCVALAYASSGGMACMEMLCNFGEVCSVFVLCGRCAPPAVHTYRLTRSLPRDFVSIYCHGHGFRPIDI